MAPKVPRIMLETQAGGRNQDYKGRKEQGRNKPVPDPKRSRPKIGVKMTSLGRPRKGR